MKALPPGPSGGYARTMRWIPVVLVNCLLALRAVLSVPFRLLGRKAKPRWIRFRLQGDLPWRTRARTRLRLGRRRPEVDVPRSLEWLRQTLEALAADGEVSGVLFEVHALEITTAKRDALIGLIRAFRAAGKQAVAWAVSPSNAEYALICHASRVLLSPAGRLELTGFAAEVMSLGEGLRKLGVTAHFVRRGEYKTAPELFTRDSLSPIQRETVDRLLDERYSDLVAQVASGRGLPDEEVRARIDRGPFSARRAVAEGLVDATVHEADLPEVLAGRAPAARPVRPTAAGIGAGPAPAGERQASGAPPGEEDGEDAEHAKILGTEAAYRASFRWPKVPWRRVRRPPVVAVIPISGTIVPGSGGEVPFGPTLCGGDAVARQLRTASRNPRVRAIVLHIDSPGGSAVASEVMLEAIERADRKKPVVAYCERVAASGGYMAAIGARELWASPHAIVGSIGVFAGKFDAAGLLNTLGIAREVLTRGRNAGIFSPSRPFTDSERAALEADVEETYQAFLEHVARSRGMTVEQVHARGEGRVFSGQRGLEQGLVDRVGGFEQACRRALELAKAPSEGPFAVAAPPSSRSLVSLLGLARQACSPTVYAWAWSVLTLREQR